MSETQSVLLEKKTYIKLKRLADENECSVNEEIGKAISEYYDIDEESLEEIDVIPRKDKVFVVLPEDIYSALEEEAETNSTDVSDELLAIFEGYLEGSEGEEDEDSEDEDEETEDEEEDEDSEDEEETEDEEEEDEEENPKKKIKKKVKKEEEKGFFDSITESIGETVGDFVEEMISGKKPKKKK